MKIGLLFPGQGSQSVGMGKDIYDKHEEARKVFDTANAVLGFDLKTIVFDGPEDVLKQTQNTQAAIFTTSIALYKVFISLHPLSTLDCLSAGHSLGEYSAMCAAGVFDLETGLKLVKARGEFIGRASEKHPGTMAAIIGLEKNVLADICAKAGACELVNFNSPGQIVIAGTVPAVTKAVELANEAKAIKTVILNVSGAFHSSHMNEASDSMAKELEKYQLKDPAFPFFTNCDASINTSGAGLKAKMARQVNSPVLWDSSIRAMIDNGADTFIEIGPGRVLSGLMRKIDKTKKTFNIEDVASLDKTLAALKA